MAGWNHEGCFREKECASCGSIFKPRGGGQKYCSEECGFSEGRKSFTTERQYESISGNWDRYFSRLLYAGGRKRSELTSDDLKDVAKSQDYKCALSGVELTCKLEVGKNFWTNASIDRIEAGGPYIKENIQLVCRGLNSWRSSVPLDEFIWWCRKVAEYNRD